MDDKVRALLASAGHVAECRDKRVAWVKATMAAWRGAERAMDKRCMEALDLLSEEEFERLVEEEEAKIELFRGPIKAAADRGLWPREMYFGRI